MKLERKQILAVAFVAGGGLFIYHQRKKRTTDNQMFWERVAKLYSKSVEKNSALYEKVIENTIQEVNTEMNVLELATGSGVIGRAIAPFCKSVIATDFSPKMIAVAKAEGIPSNLEFSVADATRLPYPDESFDAVVMGNALHIMPNPEKALVNIKRVLKKDGILIVPNFIRNNSRKERLTEKVAQIMGFYTYNPWDFEEYCCFLKANGLEIQCARLIKGVLFPLAFVTARFSDYQELAV